MSRNAIFYKDIDYSRGGSSGGGSGSSFVKLAEYTDSGAGYAAGSTITLSQDITSFDILLFSVIWQNETDGFPSGVVVVDDFINQYTARIYANYSGAGYVDVLYLSNTSISVLRTGSEFVHAVYGVKFGNGSSGGGGSTTLYGETPPTSNQGNNGDLYFHYSKGVFKYIKMNITKDRGNDGSCQLADIRFANSNNEFFDFVGNNATAESNRSYATSGETAASVIDNNVGTKVLMTNNAPSVNSPDTLIITIPDGINLTEYDIYSWYTANDATSRDPMSWTLSASNDKENWVDLDSQEDYATTTSRQVVAYSKQLENVSGAIGIIKKYVKIEDTWVAF